jgi:hypothetical protein
MAAALESIAMPNLYAQNASSINEFNNSSQLEGPLRMGLADSSMMPNRLRLLNEAEHVLSSVKSSNYRHVTYVDEADGVYDFDCSGFLDYALQQVLPAALADIKYLPNRLNRPRAQDYYYRLAKTDSRDNAEGWQSVMSPRDLLPGDVIAWLRARHSDSDDTGHVMIVYSNPSVDPEQPNEIKLRVIDSTRTPHAFDSRKQGETGLGTGTISLVMNTTESAVGFRWRDGESTRTQYTKIALGEPESSTTYLTNNDSLARSTQPNMLRSGTRELAEQMLLIVAVILACTLIVATLITRLSRSQKSSRRQFRLTFAV